MVKLVADIDKRILCMMSENPRISQAELSHRLKISQPAVSERLRKLEERGEIAHMVGSDVKKAGLFLARIDISTSKVEELLKTLELCPLYLNGFLTSGRHNLSVLFLAENARSLMSCVDSHLRRSSLVKDMDFNLIVTPLRPFIVPVRASVEKTKITPCGVDCVNCPLYAGDRCLGCPRSIHYRGSLL